MAGKRQMIDEPPLPIGGPAGVPLAGRRDVEVGRVGAGCGAGTMSATSSMILSLAAMGRLLRLG